MMKKWIVVVVGLSILVGGAWYALNSGLVQLSSAATPEAETVLPPVKVDDRVQAEAKIVPVRHASLSLSSGGILNDVFVAEGDSVDVGQLLLRVDSARQASAVAQAEAGLRRAQAQLDMLQAGPRPAEVTAVQAAVEAAQAQLARISEPAQPEEIKAAEAALGSAQASLDKALEGTDEDEATIAAAQLRRTEIALQQAQCAYDKVKYAADVGTSPEAARLEQATLDYEAAVASYNLAVRGPTGDEVAAARAQLAQAEAQLARLRQGHSEGELAAARAEIRRAQAQLELVKSGSREQEIVVAEADVTAAQATLAEARASLADTELRAPFAGTVAALNAEVGEQVTAGTPVVQIADLSAWQIETDDLTELGVVQVEPGAPVTITVDAIPDLEIAGRVVHIQPLGESKRGDITYRVVIQPEKQDERLRWNMTTAVSIGSQSPDGVAQVRRQNEHIGNGQ
jgi:HlyD family secretion protein